MRNGIDVIISSVALSVGLPHMHDIGPASDQLYEKVG